MEHPPLEETFGARLRQARTDQGLTMRELVDSLHSQGIDIDASGISRLENGKRVLRLTDAIAFSNALGLELDDMLNMGGPEQLAAHARRATLRYERAAALLREASSSHTDARRDLSRSLESLRELSSPGPEQRAAMGAARAALTEKEQS